MSLLDTNLSELKAGSGYKFTATNINDLDAAEYTLATLIPVITFEIKKK